MKCLLVVMLRKIHIVRSEMLKLAFFTHYVAVTYESPTKLKILAKTISIANKNTSMFVGRLVQIIVGRVS